MNTSILPNLPRAHPWGNSIITFNCIDSTNTRAKALAAAGAPEGTVLIADSQSDGRGRLGRSFCSPAGMGIYMSVILRPGCTPAELMHLTCATAVAICNAAETALGFRPGIKWINDLVVRKHKLAGILTELFIDPQTHLVDYAIIGIGINCCQQEEDFPPELKDIACSAAMITGRTVDRNALAGAMIISLEEMNRRLFSEKEAIMKQYRKDCITLGNPIQVIRNDLRRDGTAIDVDSDGGLAVSFADGSTETVSSGEVSVRGLYGYI